jgi:hypothetical protein
MHPFGVYGKPLNNPADSFKGALSMKAFVIAGLLLISQTSFAEKFYRCDVTTTLKKGSTSFSTVWYLSNKRTARIDLPYAKTELALTINGLEEKLEGSVNGQYNFILNGSRAAGRFESAHAKGEIKCSVGQEEKVMLVRKPGHLAKQADKSLTNRMLNASTAHEFCFVGKAEDAAEEIKATVSGVLKTEIRGQGESIALSQIEQRCVESYGSHDDYECLRYDSPREFTYTLLNCYQDYGGDR